MTILERLQQLHQELKANDSAVKLTQAAIKESSEAIRKQYDSLEMLLGEQRSLDQEWNLAFHAARIMGFDAQVAEKRVQ